MHTEPKDIVASIQARLLSRSCESGVEHQLTLARSASSACCTVCRGLSMRAVSS
jgi:hypothetical protein